jgi:hypothetical protein
MIQNQIANNTTSSAPFVAADGVVYFRGTDNKLWRVNGDGTGQSQIGHNTTKSTPFVTADGWVWFQGTDDKLLKVYHDGTQLSRPGANSTSSSPIVVGDWVYFRGTDNKLFRMDTNGSEQSVINKNTTKSTPFVTADGWVWFQGTDDKLYKVFHDGTQQSRPGANSTSSSPTVVGDWVYFRGTDNKLFRMKTDGSEQSVINKNTTKSTPFVTADGWVWFQGTDDKLWRVRSDGSHQSQVNNNKTSSTPAVGRVQIAEGTVGEWVYFQGTDNKLFRLFQPADAIGTGTMRPKYYILTVLYAPPGSNGGKGSSSVDYSTGSTTGTTTSTSSSFKNTVNVSASIGFDVSIFKLGASTDFSTSTTKTDTTSQDIKKSQAWDIKVTGPAEDGINHDHDMFVLMLNPLLAANVYPGNNVLWTMGVDGQVMNIQSVYVGWLKDPSSMPGGVKQQLDAAGLTPADYAQILSTNPFASGATAIDPNRYLPITQSFPYEPPFSATDPVFTSSFNVQNTVTVTDTHTVQHQYSVSVSFSAGIKFLSASLKIGDSMDWTNTNSLGTTSISTQSATATVGGPAFGYTGPTDIVGYFDTLYNSFMFAFPAEPPATAGTVLDAAGKPVSHQAVTLSIGPHNFKTMTNAQGQYRIYGAPEGNGSLAVDGQASGHAVAVQAGAAPATVQLT